MSSLTARIRAKKAKKCPVVEKPVETMPDAQIKALNDLLTDSKESVSIDKVLSIVEEGSTIDFPFTNCMFISCNGIDKSIKEHVACFEPIRQYSANFINRSTQDLMDNGVEHIWCDISKEKCRQWVQLNVKNSVYTPICIFKHKRSKYVEDLKEHCRFTIRIKDLRHVHGLSLAEVMTKLQDRVYVHKTPNCFMACLGLSRVIDKKSLNC
tara:strand:+ start:2079 stop:2708 length:630 start_codon:yes stop_codon:yes gene_type:complete